jgi:lysophospholipase L1-like esterase
MKNLFLKGCLVLFGLALSSILAEGVLRIIALCSTKPQQSLEEQLAEAASYSLNDIGDTDRLGALVRPSQFSDIVFELKPHLKGTFLGAAVRTNSHGLRNSEISFDKPKGISRIVGIGDSVMFGWGVEEEHSYLKVLEKRFTERGQKVQFLNFAVPGYNTTMEVATFEQKALLFAPDLVIIHYVNNDLGIPFFMATPPIPETVYNSHLLGFLRTRWVGVRASSKTDELTLNGALVQETGRPNQEISKQYRYMTGTPGYRRAMRRLLKLCKERDIPVIVLSGGPNSALIKEVKNKLARKFPLELVFARPIVENYFKTNHPDGDKELRRKLLWVGPHDPHPSELGHRLYAEALEPVIQQLLLAKSS